MLRKVLSDEASSRFGAFASAGSEDSSSAQSSLIRTTREGRMVYAEAHDENVAEDYFAAMERVEARLDLRGLGKENWPKAFPLQK